MQQVVLEQISFMQKETLVGKIQCILLDPADLHLPAHDHPAAGAVSVRSWGRALRLASCGDWWPGGALPPALAGEHSKEILETLGLGEDEVNKLISSGSVA